MKNVQERRKHERYLAQHLCVELDGKTYPVINISSGGVHFKGQGFFVGNPLTLVIRSHQDENDRIKADCKVVEIEGESVHAEFTKPTMPLMHYVIGHIGQAMGVTPQYFKKPQTGAATPAPGGV